MKIKNIGGLSAEDLQQEMADGGRFIYYSYVISLIFFSMKKTSGVYLVRANENPVNKAMPFIILSMLFGWWGIPWGPLYTIESLRSSFRGGKDVTDEVMDTVAGHILFRESQAAASKKY